MNYRLNMIQDLADFAQRLDTRMWDSVFTQLGITRYGQLRLRYSDPARTLMPCSELQRSLSDVLAKDLHARH